jgi:hypothetical protein
MAEATGVGRSGQATAAAIQIARGIVEREESEWGWARSIDRPRPEPGRLSRAQVGRLGQLASWAKQALANYFKTKFQISNSNVISFLNSNQTQKFK